MRKSNHRPSPATKEMITACLSSGLCFHSIRAKDDGSTNDQDDMEPEEWQDQREPHFGSYVRQVDCALSNRHGVTVTTQTLC